MAQFSEIIGFIEQINHEYPHYLVGQASETAENTIRSWIVAVKSDRGAILLKVPPEKKDGDSQGRDDALSVRELYESLLSLSPEDTAVVEICLVEGDMMRVDTGIVGAHLNEEDQALIFHASDF